MKRVWILPLAVVCVFTLVAVIMLRVMPGPLKDSDYLVIGSVATLMSMLVLFFVLVTTSVKSKNLFFKRRKKGP
jgi:hypothetical protein